MALLEEARIAIVYGYPSMPRMAKLIFGYPHQ